eukprot:CAMPEP_0113529588 /NCGR_PEP_ID=MMETSP0015_2-20120614/2477_1 /TAXON_ID=2838 /ORGANISM="Odontella" /LENGTH=151 /DNA_ID=CAMNT_0000428235 /DNA_START=220 /DNA_END=675 /DNA_ORIENTATION=- /assembly_acc=CAM_ASM_000160
MVVAFSSLPYLGTQIRTQGWMTPRTESARRAFLGEDIGSDSLIGGDSACLPSIKESIASTTSFYEDLRAREEQIKHGIGRRYRTRTQKGFLNIHSDPKRGPFCLDTIVGQLVEGQVVTSIAGEKYSNWVQHDAGWSIADFNGVTWLEPIED